MTVDATLGTSRGLLIAIALSACAIFVADLSLPLGIALWSLYFAPVALSNLAWRPSAPLVTAAACSVFIVAGYFLSSGRESAAAHYAPLNRGFGVVAIWSAAILGRRFIVSRLEVRREDWLKAAQTGLGARMEGELTQAALGENILSFLTEYLHAQVGAIYLADGEASYRRFGTHSIDPSSAGPDVVRLGEGVVGQAARDDRLVHLEEVPEKYIDVRSGLGGHPPRDLVVAPASVDGKVHAVVELGFLNRIDDGDLELFARVSRSIASAVRSITYRTRQGELLEETQRQGEELQTQHEELRVQNEELEQQSRTLQESQMRLENQQAELTQINSQLEEQTQALERQRDDLTRAQADLQRASTYKSEFLANMSHELRTPLNSSLILAKLLLDNREGNLNPEQVKFAQTIYSAGNDLLTLINDILDLSKIEAGKLDVRPETIPLARLVDELLDGFKPIAQDKRLDIGAQLDDDLPAVIETDPTRLQQILRNLLSNALKFTERGGVFLSIRRAASEVVFDVKDTGIGIASDQHEVIFEAFRQADGTTSRKYGGTGLGLSISRDLARVLGGDLTVDSGPGRGSTFTLVLPERYVAKDAVHAPRRQATSMGRPVKARPEPTSGVATSPALDDDRSKWSPGGRSILVIEDDLGFARVLQSLAHQLEFQALLATTADEGLKMAERYRPSAIVLDAGLPDRSGLSVLDTLKHNPVTRHIPVHMISVSDYAQTALEMGAAGYALKPIPHEQLVEALKRLESKFTQRVRRILIVEDDETHRASTSLLLAGDGVEIVAVGTAADALRELGASTFDCMVLDLSLPDRTGFELLDDMSQKEQYAFPPVVVYTGRSLSSDEERQLRRFSQSIIIKGARSPERLLDEVTLFLHQVEAELPPDRQRMLRDARHRDAVFEGRRVLVVEDDVRNIFALTSVLEPKGARVEVARNGREALAHLEKEPGVDLVLMDIMMPEMDGLQATREIRKQAKHARLPIIALTAKAMADDRENCLAAGANDYIAKPLDVDKLLSLARVWMPK
ncbi:MAG: response regulator [Labilithrix sp.]|nr:response regulator [Labilithrix sp.]